MRNIVHCMLICGFVNGLFNTFGAAPANTLYHFPGSFPVVSAPVPIRIPFSLRQVKRQPNGSAPLQSKEHLVTQPIPSCATELANVVEAAAAVAEEKTRRRALDQLTGPPPPAIWSNSAEAVCTELFKVVLDVCIDDLKDLTEDLPELEPEQPEPPR